MTRSWRCAGLGILVGLLTGVQARAAEFNLKVTVSDVRLGDGLMGPKITEADLRGKVVLLDFWGIGCIPCLQQLPHTAKLYEELADFGLLIVGPHAQKGSSTEIKAKAQALGVTFPVTNNAGVSGAQDFSFLPHCFVFDHTGKCLFRGDPAVTEPRLREAVGKAIVDSMEKTSFTSSIKPLTQALQKGQSPAQVLQKAIPLIKVPDAATAAEAKLLVEKLTAGGKKKLDQADDLLKEDAVAGYNSLLKLPTVYKGTDVAAKATAKLAELKKDKNVQAELSAQPTLNEIKKIDGQLDAVIQMTSADPKGAEFQKTYATVLKQMKTTLQKMKKSYPQAKATQEAVQIADRYGVEVK